MTAIALIGARILSDGEWRDAHALIHDAGRIVAVRPVAEVRDRVAVERLDDGMLVPGFIDTQVNGGGGRLLNDDPSVATLRVMAAAHRQFGTTAMLPTLISDDLDKVAVAIAAVDAAIEAGVPGIIGIHLEGPFLNAGKRGIHDAAKLRTPDMAVVALLSSLRRGRTLVTLAPELAPPGLIRALVESGVVVAAGHSLATYDEMQRARDEGLSAVTHLFNAMTQLEGRAPGVVGAALDSDLVCGIIADGHHVHAASLRAALRAKGAAQLMLVTDAMALTGTTQDRFRLGTEEIRRTDGALRSADGTLAGSALDMSMAVRNAMIMLGVDLATASQMASGTPAAALGLAGERGRIVPGLAADFVHLDDGMQVRATWIAGVRG